MSTLAEQVGALVRRHRKKAGLSQAQLAERIDRQTNAVQRLESGDSSLTLDTLSRLCDALNVEAWEFFRLGEFAVSDSRVDPLDAILRQLAGVSDDDLAKIQDLIAAALKLRR